MTQFTSLLPSALSKNSPPKALGFTFIEMLIVVLIIALAALSATMVMTGGGGRMVEQKADEFVAIFQLAEQEAWVNQQELGLYIWQQGYIFLQYHWREERWLPLARDRLLTRYQLPDEIELQLELNGQHYRLLPNDNQRQAPQIIFSAAGGVTPFQLQFLLERQPHVTITAGPTGEISFVNDE